MQSDNQEIRLQWSKEFLFNLRTELTHMKSLTLEEIAQQWFNAFNAHNLEELLALYDDQAIHFSPKLKIRQPETRGLIKGKSALREWWKDSFDRLPGLQYHPTSFTANEQRVFMEYIRSVPGEPDMLIAEVLEISHGKINASRVYHG